MGEENAVATLDAGQIDDLSGAVSLQAELSDSGLTVKGQSRALAALDQLVGGVIGTPGAYAEGFRSRVASRQKHQLCMLEAKQAQQLAQARSHLSIEEASATRRVAENIKLQTNREAVWIEAIDAVKLLPPPIDQQSDTPDQDEMDPDWMNHFVGYAEKASSESIRKLWGRILAGEIRKPRSFSISALRILSELDASTAVLFQSVVEVRLKPDQILAPEQLQGNTLLELTSLEELGLLQNAAAPLNFNTTILDEVPIVPIQVGDFCLKCYAVPQGELSWPVILITKAGRQIADLVVWDQERAARQLAARVKGNFSIELAKIIHRESAERFYAEGLEFLRRSPSA